MKPQSRRYLIYPRYRSGSLRRARMGRTLLSLRVRVLNLVCKAHNSPRRAVNRLLSQAQLMSSQHPLKSLVPHSSHQYSLPLLRRPSVLHVEQHPALRLFRPSAHRTLAHRRVHPSLRSHRSLFLCPTRGPARRSLRAPGRQARPWMRRMRIVCKLSSMKRKERILQGLHLLRRLEALHHLCHGERRREE